MVLNHGIGVVTEKWFQGQAGNTSMFLNLYLMLMLGVGSDTVINDLELLTLITP